MGFLEGVLEGRVTLIVGVMLGRNGAIEGFLVGIIEEGTIAPFKLPIIYAIKRTAKKDIFSIIIIKKVMKLKSVLKTEI